MADEVSKELWQKIIIAIKFDVVVVGTKTAHNETEDPQDVIHFFPLVKPCQPSFPCRWRVLKEYADGVIFYIPESYIMNLSDFCWFMLCTCGRERGGWRVGGWREGDGLYTVQVQLEFNCTHE